MTQQKILARDIIVQVESSTPNTWFQLEGLTSVGPNPSDSAEDAEITDFDSGGRPQYLPAQRGASMKLEGQKLLDSVTGDAAPGQGRCETLADTLGYPGIGRIRFRHPLQTTWVVWNAVMQVGEQGGGNNDPGKWACDIKRSGASSSVAVS